MLSYWSGVATLTGIYLIATLGRFDSCRFHRPFFFGTRRIYGNRSIWNGSFH